MRVGLGGFAPFCDTILAISNEILKDGPNIINRHSVLAYVATIVPIQPCMHCLLYTSDAADE